MSKPKVFIDGSAGTTGLRIRDWLAGRDDIQLLEIDHAARRDPEARRKLLNEADLAILCLPDDAAVEAVSWIDNARTRVLDASTAHRVANGWVYGLPELTTEQREAIREEPRVANPGCWPTAAVLSLRPLVDAGLVAESAPAVVHGVSGYSGAGRSGIEKWESPENGLQDLPFEAPYALDKKHKHIPEMTKYSGLTHQPHFIPAVGPFKCGMRVEISLHEALLQAGATARDVFDTLHERYAGEKFVSVTAIGEGLEDVPGAVSAYGDKSFDPRGLNDTNRIEIAVLGNPLGHVLLIARLDNLGKGASGAAIQNMNLMLGLPEDHGLPT